MKIINFLLCLAPGCSLLVPSAPASTAPVGYLTYTFPATNELRTTYISAPLSAASVCAGTVSSATSNTITDANADWSAGEFVQTPFYVLITSGLQAGRTLAVVANTATKLTLDVADSSPESTSPKAEHFAVAPGDSFEIVPSLTLGSFFGATAAELTLAGGSDVNTADDIGLWNRKQTAFDFYFFNTGAGHWVKSGDATLADQVNLAIPPNAAMALVRQAGRSPARVVLTGAVPTVAPLLKLIGGDSIQYYGSAIPVDLTLDHLGLGANWQKGGSVEKADVLSLYGAARMIWRSYFERKSGAWSNSKGTVNADATLVTPGSGIALRKHREVSGAASFLQIRLPYTP